MKFDFIVSGMEKSQDGIPCMYVTLANPNNLKAGTDKMPPECPFDPNQTTITSPEDLMKNLPDAMANIGGSGRLPTVNPTLKVTMREYEDMSIKVGDEVTIEIKKADTSGI